MLTNLLGANPALEVATLTFPEAYWRQTVRFIVDNLDKAVAKDTNWIERITLPSPMLAYFRTPVVRMVPFQLKYMWLVWSVVWWKPVPQRTNGS